MSGSWYRGLNLIEETLPQIKYKPDWDFRLRTRGPDIYLLITAMVPNSWSERRELIAIGQEFMVPPMFFNGEFRIDSFLEWVGMAITQIETHERDEWFTFQGKFVKNPHPEPISA